MEESKPFSISKKLNTQRGSIPLPLLIGIIGVLAFFSFAYLAPFKSLKLVSLFPKQFGFAATTTNLLSNGDFEADFTNWNKGTGTGWARQNGNISIGMSRTDHCLRGSMEKVRACQLTPGR